MVVATCIRKPGWLNISVLSLQFKCLPLALLCVVRPMRVTLKPITRRRTAHQTVLLAGELRMDTSLEPMERCGT